MEIWYVAYLSRMHVGQCSIGLLYSSAQSGHGSLVAPDVLACLLLDGFHHVVHEAHVKVFSTWNPKQHHRMQA